MEIYILKKPATKGERTIKQLEIARPKVAHFARTDGHPTDSIAADRALLSALTGEPELLLDEIDIEDWANIRQILERIWLQFFNIKPVYSENPPKQEAGQPETPTA